MTWNFLLNFRLAMLRPEGGDNNTHDFRLHFNPLIELGPAKKYRVAMNRLITMTYSWCNVAAAHNNNTLKWWKTGEA